MQLTLEQRKQIEDSIWVVNTALKNQGLSHNEDMRQSALLYMCGCITRFDPKRNIKWTTFAYRNVYLFIKRTIAKQRQKQIHIIDDDFDNLSNAIADDRLTISDSWLEFNGFVDDCNKDEKRVLKLKLQGYNGKEIAIKMKCSTSKINGCMQNIREKAMRM